MPSASLSCFVSRVSFLVIGGGGGEGTVNRGRFPPGCEGTVIPSRILDKGGGGDTSLPLQPYVRWFQMGARAFPVRVPSLRPIPFEGRVTKVVLCAIEGRAGPMVLPSAHCLAMNIILQARRCTVYVLTGTARIGAILRNTKRGTASGPSRLCARHRTDHV